MIFRKEFYLIAVILFAFTQSIAQYAEGPKSPDDLENEAEMEFASTITEQDLKEYLDILASDALEGRETGERGQKMAAAFIKAHFEQEGLLPIVPHNQEKSYYQAFNLYRNYYGEIYVKVGDQKKEHLQDILFYGDADISQPLTRKIYFVGKGETKDYEGLEVEDAAVIFFAEARAERRQKVALAKEKGAKAFFVISNPDRTAFDDYLERYQHYFTSGQISTEAKPAGDDAVFFIYPELAAEMLQVKPGKLEDVLKKNQEGNQNFNRKIKPQPITYKVEKKSEAFLTENVLGLVEGTDKKDELIVITAHYDHVGVDGEEVFNGADDDGSGTSAVLEMAQAFAHAKKAGHGPRRSVLFMTVTGEEKGLLGSSYYVDNPVVPLENTVANLNIDMIGRVDPEHKEQPNYVYLIGSDKLSKELHDLNEKANNRYTQMELDYTYNDENDPNRFYYRSDHYNFARNNIPIIFYFNGTHADYHKSTDTVEKINFEMLKKRTQLVFHTAWELANREERVKLD